MHEMQRETEMDVAIKRNHAVCLSILASALCTTTLLKAGEIQFLELVLVFDIVLVAGWVLTHPRPFRLYRPFLRIGIHWIIFSLVALLLAVVNLRFEFLPNGFSALKQPLVVSIARIAEVGIDVYMMLFLAGAYRRDEALCRSAALIYFWVGVAGGIYSILSEVALATHLGVFGAYGGYRMRGFDNEGGPYGSYLISVFFVALLVHSKGWISRGVFRGGMALLAVCLLGSQSKAAFFQVALFALLIPMLRRGGIKSFAVAVASFAITAAIFLNTTIGQQTLKYAKVATNYQQLSQLHTSDFNFVTGRVAGLFFAPQMIEAHPLTGIGFGNYPLLRNNPEFRRGTPIIEASADSPSLGLVDYVVDLGIPLFLYLTWIQISSALPLMRRGKSVWMAALVLIQPVSTWFGTHLNLTYPWVVAAIGLGVFYGYRGDPLSDSGNIPNKAAALLPSA